MYAPLVSIIIPCKNIDNYLMQCIEKIKELKYKNFEIIVLPDSGEHSQTLNLIIYPTGPISPGAKRNIGQRLAKGDIFAYIDSDAYPTADWLTNAVKYIQNGINVIGGPGLTPPEDNEKQEAGGYILSSKAMGGLSSRYSIHGLHKTDLIHSVNMIVKKEIMEKVGGWDERLWPGEDAQICYKFRKLGIELYESGDVVVYHHRRSLFIPHLKQIAAYAKYRGYLSKNYGWQMVRLIYLLPSILLIYLFFGIIFSLFNNYFREIFLATFIIYIILILIMSLMASKKKSLFLLVFFGTILTHITYGVYFFVGLLTGVKK
jgi:GT2 family glycosyltransferase